MQSQTKEDRNILLQWERCWQRIQRDEKLGTAESMRLAQDRHSDLYAQFLACCPRGSI